LPAVQRRIDLVADFLAHEWSRDDRPITGCRLSAPGIPAHHVAAKAPRGSLAGIIGMTFLTSASSRSATGAPTAGSPPAAASPSSLLAKTPDSSAG
jgi:hypothetical protein